METRLDEIDTRLIALLQEDSSRPVKSLAARLGISIATVHRRRESLLERGVIRRYTVEVDPLRAGRPALFLVEALLQPASERVVEHFKRRVRDCPDVIECYHVAGDCTFLLLVALAAPAGLPPFARWLAADDTCTLQVRTSLVLDQVKRGFGGSAVASFSASSPGLPPRA